ncbi:MAG TPA: hypothetical protein VGF29_03455 [Hyphomicrobiaceae bacterium]|jgi:hypothetical protein
MTVLALRIDGRPYRGTRRAVAELNRRVAQYRLEGMSKKAATLRAAQEMRASPRKDWQRSPGGPELLR